MFCSNIRLYSKYNRIFRQKVCLYFEYIRLFAQYRLTFQQKDRLYLNYIRLFWKYRLIFQQKDRLYFKYIRLFWEYRLTFQQKVRLYLNYIRLFWEYFRLFRPLGVPQRHSGSHPGGYRPCRAGRSHPPPLLPHHSGTVESVRPSAVTLTLRMALSTVPDGSMPR